jgi:hypothetical protein
MQPGPRLALGFRDFAGGHIFGDFGAAFLAAFISAKRGEIEPFMRLDQINIDPVAAR